LSYFFSIIYVSQVSIVYSHVFHSWYNAERDDAVFVSRTMPPYHRHVVLGPKDPDKVCDMIKEKTGVDAVIIDANDLHKADCVGASKGVDKKYVEKLFLDNPSGNSEQQTPIVVIKNYKSHIPTSA